MTISETTYTCSSCGRKCILTIRGSEQFEPAVCAAGKNVSSVLASDFGKWGITSQRCVSENSAYGKLI